MTSHDHIVRNGWVDPTFIFSECDMLTTTNQTSTNNALQQLHHFYSVLHQNSQHNIWCDHLSIKFSWIRFAKAGEFWAQVSWWTSSQILVPFCIAKVFTCLAPWTAEYTCRNGDPEGLCSSLNKAPTMTEGCMGMWLSVTSMLCCELHWAKKKQGTVSFIYEPENIAMHLLTERTIDNQNSPSLNWHQHPIPLLCPTTTSAPPFSWHLWALSQKLLPQNLKEGLLKLIQPISVFLYEKKQ